MLSQGDRAGFEAWVETTKGAERLVFHDVRYSAPNGPSNEGSTEAFMECEEGSEFSVHVKKGNPSGSRDWGVATYINGEKTGSLVLQPTNELAEFSLLFERENGKTYSRALRFSTISNEILDDGDGKSLSKEFGTISIVISAGKSSNLKSNQPVAITAFGAGKLDERAVKVGATVDLGQKQLHKELRRSVDWAFDPTQQVYYRFTWKYRTREKLLQMGILKELNPESPPPVSRKRPRSPTPPPIDEDATTLLETEGKPDIAILSAQAKRLKYLEIELKKANEKLKSGSHRAGNDGVIDLSMDDDDE